MIPVFFEAVTASRVTLPGAVQAVGIARTSSDYGPGPGIIIHAGLRTARRPTSSVSDSDGPAASPTMANWRCLDASESLFEGRPVPRPMADRRTGDTEGITRATSRHAPTRFIRGRYWESYT